jgi:hypothetical protein
MDTLTQTEAADMIRKNHGGRIFSVTFTKRSTKSPRRMTGRIGVTQGVTGAGQKFNARDHHLITMMEFVGRQGARGRHGNIGKQWRNVSIEGITSLRIAGKEFQVTA